MKWICFGKKNRQPFRLTREAFEADTLSKPPFTFNYRNYAVCPACLNAVQILGIRTELKNTPDPYANTHSLRFPNWMQFRMKSLIETVLIPIRNPSLRTVDTRTGLPE